MLETIDEEKLHRLGERFLANKIRELTGASFEDYLRFPQTYETMAKIQKGLTWPGKKGQNA